MADTDAPATCTVCFKSGSDAMPLKRCAKCQTQRYCSRECQKADWTKHKKTCGESADEKLPNPFVTQKAFPRPQTLEVHIQKPFHELHNKTWLHNRHENDVYQLLIDVYRMRMEDRYVFFGDADLDCIYGGAPHSGKEFRRFLRLTEGHPGLLPEWWSSENAMECMAFGLRPPNGWSSLAHPVEKADVIDHHKDPSFPMQLRMFGEQVWGMGPAGLPGAVMMQQMMQVERGEGVMILENHASAMRFA
ncbi:putative MYND domain protein [Aspergillus sclerotioniger CBS 115572]|uniref:Putative MYND domain protein n=1 Tax=Aspergillus sclerotioniger CBS 115572 TaxID=1450535 RepID=A0A317WBR4_9EURO|nr:putative MYND domain protein [Aspergillus sclerotioniger CBS 115572]PWY83793.1 putative MYND domain protein [Aspergillus sclerotioniger CBS 115572]